MQRNNLVSVIIPVFNVRPYLCEALESVIHQTYGNLEIIVVDDGSTDGSAEICDGFAQSDSRIVVIHQENRGLSAARNAGLDRATGQGIAFLDPDDAFLPDCIQIMADQMNAHRADIVVCGFSIHRTQGRMRPQRIAETALRCRVIDRNQSLREIVDRCINSAVWNKLYDRAVWEGLRFPEGRVYEGTYCLVELFERANRITVLPGRLVMHRIRPGSICNTVSLKNILDSEYASDHFIACIERNTPAAVSYAQLQKQIQNRVRGLIGSYLKYTCEYSEDLKGQRDVRNMLVKAADEVGLDHCNPLIVMGYHLVLTCPRLCVLLYRACRRFLGF